MTLRPRKSLPLLMPATRAMNGRPEREPRWRWFEKQSPNVVRRRGAVVAEVVDAIDLGSTSPGRECGFESRRPHDLEPRYKMAKKKVPSTKKRGPKPETLTIEGDWKDAVAAALKRGKPSLENKKRRS